MTLPVNQKSMNDECGLGLLAPLIGLVVILVSFFYIPLWLFLTFLGVSIAITLALGVLIGRNKKEHDNFISRRQQ